MRDKGSDDQWPIFQESFSELQEMSDCHPLLDFSYRQLGRGQFQGDFFGCGLPHGIFWRSRLNLSLEGEADIPPGYALVALSQGSPDYWHNQIVPADSLAFGKGPHGLRHRSKANHEAWVFLLSFERYYEVAKTLGLEASSFAETPPVQAVLPGPMAELRTHIADFLDMAQSPRGLDADWVTWFENELIRRTLHALNASEKDSDVGGQLGESTATAVHKIMHQKNDRSLCITTLCQDLSISERTLRDHFTKCYDISPAAYHLILRLNRVRSRLLFSKPAKGVVSAVATEAGFWHMSRFAKHYHRQFGESPTATLQREARTESLSSWGPVPLIEQTSQRL